MTEVKYLANFIGIFHVDTFEVFRLWEEEVPVYAFILFSNWRCISARGYVRPSNIRSGSLGIEFIHFT